MTPDAIKQLENDLWRSADTLRANSDLKAGEYSTPVLGLIFLKFADNRYRSFEKDILKQANTYYENPHDSFGRFDYVLTNPPFNVDDVSLSSVEKDRRFTTYGIPRKKTKVKKSEEGKETVPNANYLWINHFATSLTDKGRAALGMANSASDACHSEADIRRTLIENNLISGMLTLPSNMFYTL